MESVLKEGWLNRHNRDYYGGALMLLFGGGAIYKGLGYKVGSLRSMGPGYFPVAVGVVLALMGLIIVVGAARARSRAHKESQPAEWRGWLCIILSLIVFVVLGRFGGLVPASFAVVFISALGDRDNTVKSAFLLACAMALIAVVVFSWALQLQFPLFRWG